MFAGSAPHPGEVRPDKPGATLAPAPEPPPEEASATKDVRTRAVRRWLSPVALVALVASALVAMDPAGIRERLFGSVAPPRPAAVSRIAGAWSTTQTRRSAPGQTTMLRSQPWWESLGTLQGNGSAVAPALSIDDGATQWRLRWSCDRGELLVRMAARQRPLLDTSCPAHGDAYASKSGLVRLEVQATGPWRLEAQQDVDLPLDEPPAPEVTQPGTVVTASGAFYRLDQVGKGRAIVYRLPTGQSLLRLQDFYVSPNTDLEVRLSPLAAPRSTDEFFSAPSVWVAPLDITAGSMNLPVPDSVHPSRYRSVVIWCERLHSAYAAASLTPRTVTR